ncbi:MAG: cystathionine gamma-synthase [Deltaproteobacteria bacterium]|nr:cystathionine gamma-synthase [Deltaproteobacteria bacterium]
MKVETVAIHVGQKPDPLTGAVITPLYQSSTFEQDGIGQPRGYAYSRAGNPTREALETVLASLEGGRFGLAFASGVAATTAVFHALLKNGDHAIVGDNIYGGTYRLLERIFKPWNLKITYVEADNIEAYGDAIRPNTRLIWVETPTNPLLKIVDIARLAEAARRGNCFLAVDNTFATPYFQRPLEYGAHIVAHSTTKYIAGHSDIIGGATVTSDEEIQGLLKNYQCNAGAVPSPWDCWLALRGIKTLGIRMREHEHNALYLATWLESHPQVEKVYYPGLASHKDHALAKEQMSGFGGMIGIELAGGFSAVEKFIGKLKLFTLAESLGGVESLVSCPAKMTHSIFTEEQRTKIGIKDNLVRLSVGIEHREDLKEDLEEALNGE